MKFKMDPRTKLYLLLLGNLAMFFHISIYAEIVLMTLVLFLFFVSGKRKAGIRMTMIYVVFIGTDFILIPIAEGFWLNLLSLLSVGIRVMLPCIVTGAYAFSTTSVGELISGLRKMRIPESIIIPCVVVIRFFPTIKEDYMHIKNAMMLRGIVSGKWTFIRHPIKTLEYILIPLLMNGSNVAQDLTVAALTKGISLPGKHTSVTEIGMKRFDWGYMILCTLPFLCFWGGVL